MKPLSRRSILRSAAGSAAVIALSPASRIWAQTPPDDRMIESTMTGSVIELIDDAWNFELGFGGMEEGDGYLRELYLMDSDTAALEVEFVQTDLTPEGYLELVQERYQTNWHQFELADSGATDDGLWFAASATTTAVPVSMYCELQVGAFEQADLMITLLSEPPLFAESVSSAQEGVLIGDLEPFIMIEPSDVMSLEFPVLAIAVATETTRRTTRSSRTVGGTEEAQDDRSSSRRSNRRGESQPTSTATTDGDFVEVVRAHRDEFLVTFNAFNTAMSTFFAETSTEEEQAESFEAIAPLAEVWTTYPQQASQATAPAEFAELEALYLDWADEIGALGTSWLDFLGRTATVEEFFAQLDIVDEIDLELGAALDAL